MPDAITNLETDKFFEKEEDEDIEKNYMEIYSIDSLTRFYDIIKKGNVKCPFAIFNTDKHNKPGTHRWSFLDVYLKKIIIIIL